MTILVLHEDEFGRAVAEDLASMLGDASTMPLRDAISRDGLIGGDVGFVVVAANHPHPEAFARIADCAWENHIPLTFAVFQGSLLVCGPVILRGSSPCHDCYVRRDSAQMESPRMPDHEQVLRRAYDSHPDLDSPGHLPTEVRLAALTMLAQIEQPAGSAGRISMTSRIDSRRGMTEIIALHGCDCRRGLGEERADPLPRQLRRMEPLLRDLLA